MDIDPAERMTLDELAQLADTFERLKLSDAAVRMMREHVHLCRVKGKETVQRLGYKEFLEIAGRYGKRNPC